MLKITKALTELSEAAQAAIRAAAVEPVGRIKKGLQARAAELVKAEQKISFTTNRDQPWKDPWDNDRPVTIKYHGRDPISGVRMYGMWDESGNFYGGDPRGVLGDHQVDWLEAKEYDMTGPDVFFTWMTLNNDSTTADKAEAYAKAKWQPKGGAAPATGKAARTPVRKAQGTGKYKYLPGSARPTAEISAACDGGDYSNETRRLDLGGEGAVIVCYRHYLEEIAGRKARNLELEPDAQFDLPTWESLPVYESTLTGEKQAAARPVAWKAAATRKAQNIEAEVEGYMELLALEENGGEGVDLFDSVCGGKDENGEYWIADNGSSELSGGDEAAARETIRLLLADKEAAAKPRMKKALGGRIYKPDAPNVVVYAENFDDAEPFLSACREIGVPTGMLDMDTINSRLDSGKGVILQVFNTVREYGDQENGDADKMAAMIYSGAPVPQTTIHRDITAERGKLRTAGVETTAGLDDTTDSTTSLV